jgi:hypothetical protein
MVVGPYRSPGPLHKGVGLPPTGFPAHGSDMVHSYCVAHDENRCFRGPVAKVRLDLAFVTGRNGLCQFSSGHDVHGNLRLCARYQPDAVEKDRQARPTRRIWRQMGGSASRNAGAVRSVESRPPRNCRRSASACVTVRISRPHRTPVAASQGVATPRSAREPHPRAPHRRVSEVRRVRVPACCRGRRLVQRREGESANLAPSGSGHTGGSSLE